MRKDIIEKCKTCKQICFDMKNDKKCEIYDAHSVGYRTGTLHQEKFYQERFKHALELYEVINNMIDARIDEREEVL